MNSTTGHDSTPSADILERVAVAQLRAIAETLGAPATTTTDPGIAVLETFAAYVEKAGSEPDQYPRLLRVAEVLYRATGTLLEAAIAVPDPEPAPSGEPPAELPLEPAEV